MYFWPEWLLHVQDALSFSTEHAGHLRCFLWLICKINSIIYLGYINHICYRCCCYSKNQCLHHCHYSTAVVFKDSTQDLIKCSHLPTFLSNINDFSNDVTNLKVIMEGRPVMTSVDPALDEMEEVCIQWYWL